MGVGVLEKKQPTVSRSSLLFPLLPGVPPAPGPLRHCGGERLCTAADAGWASLASPTPQRQVEVRL